MVSSSVYESDRLDDWPHPRDAERLFAHGGAERDLLEAYRTERLHHAWLIGGPRGIGKATLAWRFARFLLAYPDPRAPEVQHATDLGVPASHPVWARLQAGAIADVAVLRREWNDKTKKPFSDIRVDDVRDALQLFQRASAAGGDRICIVDSAEDLNRSSANALLKVIEEPPPRSVFLIVAHQPRQVMPTILSRCRKLFLSPLGEVDLMEVVAGLGAGPHAVSAADSQAVLARAGGSAGQLLALLEDTRLDIDRALQAELARLPDVDWRGLHRLADRLGSAGPGGGGILLETVLDWLGTRIHQGAAQGIDARRLAPFAEVWEKVRAAAREAEALNLDQRPLLLSVFADLSAAARAGRF